MFTTIHVNVNVIIIILTSITNGRFAANAFATLKTVVYMYLCIYDYIEIAVGIKFNLIKNFGQSLWNHIIFFV